MKTISAKPRPIVSGSTTFVGSGGGVSLSWPAATVSNPFCPKATIGLQFPVVTVLSSQPLEQVEDSTALYIALTRHTKELHVRCPTEAHPTT